MDRSFEFWIHSVHFRHHFSKEMSKNSSSTESSSFRRVAANSSAFISWRIFASSWKSAKKIDFCPRNFLFFPSWGFFALTLQYFQVFPLLSKKASFSFIESISWLWHSWKHSKVIEQKFEKYVEILWHSFYTAFSNKEKKLWVHTFT